MAKEIIKRLNEQDWFQSLIDDCRSLLTEGIYNYRLTLIKVYHLLGKRILEENDNFKREKIYGERLCHAVSESLGQSQRTIWRAIQFAKKYPDLDKFIDTTREQKILSWHKIVQNYLPEPKENKIELPKRKYQVIYADIPWSYDVDLSSGATRSPERNYPVMDLDKIKSFGEKIKEITAENCVLFMWITAPKLNWMNDVLEAWGFQYKTNLIWDKVKPLMGHYSSVRHEILIIAGKGNSAPACDGKTIQSIDSVQVIEKSSKHSEKPKEFYGIIEKLYPNTQKIELFLRGKSRQGWDGWGDEAL